MRILEIFHIPHKGLRQVAEEVTNFESIKPITQAMVDTLEYLRGRGLAAEQVKAWADGMPQRIFVMNLDARPAINDDPNTAKPASDNDSSRIGTGYYPRVFINPKITKYSEKTWVAEERCFSVKGQVGGKSEYVPVQVERAWGIEVEYFTIKDGTVIKVTGEKFEEWAAKVFQHELDHLNGKVIADLLPIEDQIKYGFIEPVELGGELSDSYPMTVHE